HLRARKCGGLSARCAKVVTNSFSLLNASFVTCRSRYTCFKHCAAILRVTLQGDWLGAIYRGAGDIGSAVGGLARVDRSHAHSVADSGLGLEPSNYLCVSSAAV